MLCAHLLHVLCVYLLHLFCVYLMHALCVVFNLCYVFTRAQLASLAFARFARVVCKSRQRGVRKRST